MKVKELIRKLNMCDPDTEILQDQHGDSHLQSQDIDVSYITKHRCRNPFCYDRKRECITKFVSQPEQFDAIILNW